MKLDPVDICLLVLLTLLLLSTLLRTIAVCGIWSNLRGIRKELAKGNERASRFCDFSDYPQYDDYWRRNHED